MVERLTLGEKVKSPEAVDLPLDLAIALLEDSNGVIDLGLPVSGNLDSPEFELRGADLESGGQPAHQIVTSLGYGTCCRRADAFNSVAFEAGMADYTAAGKENSPRSPVLWRTASTK